MSPDDAAGFVLAGGQSSRMGRDKARAEFAGGTLIGNALSILRGAGLEPQIAGSRSNLAQFAPVIDDRDTELGPLSGICTALGVTQAAHAVFIPHAVFISVDQPLIPPALIACLLHRAQITGSAVTLASLCGEPQTFPAVLSRPALPTLQAELSAGRRGCFKAFQAAGIGTVAVEFLVQTGQAADPRQLAPYLWFLNANTPDELARVNTIACTRPIAARIP